MCPSTKSLIVKRDRRRTCPTVHLETGGFEEDNTKKL